MPFFYKKFLYHQDTFYKHNLKLISQTPTPKKKEKNIK